MPAQAISIYKWSLGSLRINNVASFASTVRHLRLFMVKGIILAAERVVEVLNIPIRMEHTPWLDTGRSFAGLED